MLLLIDILEEEYNRIQSMDWKNGDRWYGEDIRAIHDGQIIPKDCDALSFLHLKKATLLSQAEDLDLPTTI